MGGEGGVVSVVIEKREGVEGEGGVVSMVIEKREGGGRGGRGW